MTAYWFPDLGGAQRGYKPIDVTEVDGLDVYCGPCGDTKPRRLAYFVRPGGTTARPVRRRLALARLAPVGVRPFIAEGELQGPAYWAPAGAVRWRLVCAHHSNISLLQVEKVMDAGISRVLLWPDGRISA